MVKVTIASSDTMHKVNENQKEDDQLNKDQHIDNLDIINQHLDNSDIDDDQLDYVNGVDLIEDVKNEKNVKNHNLFFDYINVNEVDLIGDVKSEKNVKNHCILQHLIVD